MSALLALALSASSVQAQDLSGFVEVRLQGYTGVDEGGAPLTLIERFRPTFFAPLTDRVGLSTTIESGLAQGWTTARAFADFADAQDLDLGGFDAFSLQTPDNDFLGISSASNYLAVDRLYLEVQLPVADLRIGRQALNWGSGFAINPSDPFPEVLLTEPWRPRAGVNAVRADIPFGDLNSVRLIAGADDAFLHPRLAGRVTVNALGADISAVGAWREEIDEAIVGLDVKGTLGVGLWFEGVVHLDTGTDDEDIDPYEELVAGLDYSFPVLEQFIVTAQYYRNGSGSTDLSTPALFSVQRPFAPAFQGRDYVLGSVSAGLTRDLSGSVFWIQNLNDGTAFAVPNLTLIALQNYEFSLAGQIPIGFSDEGGDFKPADDALVVSLPTDSGDLTEVDLGGLVPEATLILWSRFNF